MSDQAIKIHTFFAMHEHLSEQGHALAYYQRDHSKQLVAYLKTDHPGFFQACQQTLSQNFTLKELNAHFVLPRGYQLVYGTDKRVAKAV